MYIEEEINAAIPQNPCSCFEVHHHVLELGLVKSCTFQSLVWAVVEQFEALLLA
ncbi:hypothetical protein HanPI659440_Chr00c08g0720321 [Helianthus annuus]|nr:hypothetical protein HanPI659440_Chr00c08g0720321 [Helianthus annuus]